MQYLEYINSIEWKELSSDIKRSRHYRCEACGSIKRLQCHHVTYNRLGREKRSDLFVLCRDCHSKYHAKYKARDMPWGKTDCLKRHVKNTLRDAGVTLLPKADGDAGYAIVGNKSGDTYGHAQTYQRAVKKMRRHNHRYHEGKQVEWVRVMRNSCSPPSVDT